MAYTGLWSTAQPIKQARCIVWGLQLSPAWYSETCIALDTKPYSDASSPPPCSCCSPVVSLMRSIQQHLKSAKDARDPLRLLCLCGQVYISAMKQSVSAHIGEHRQSCRLGQLIHMHICSVALDSYTVLCTTIVSVSIVFPTIKLVYHTTWCVQY